jgi:hypothetical protein
VFDVYGVPPPPDVIAEPCVPRPDVTRTFDVSATRRCQFGNDRKYEAIAGMTVV